MKTTYTRDFANQWTTQQQALLNQALASAQNLGLSPERAYELGGLLHDLGVDADTVLAAILFDTAMANPLAHHMADKFPPEIQQLWLESMEIMNKRAQWFADEKTDGDSAEQIAAKQMMLLSVVKDIRVIFIVLAVQLIIMRHLKNKPRDIQIQIASDARTIYTSLANRLGIGQIKWEMEDLSFRYLEEQQYKLIAKALEERRTDREQFIANFVSTLSQKLHEEGISAQVYGRPKHIYSIWRKMKSKQLSFNELYDVRAVRVVVDSIANCYAALSVVHSLWPYIPGEYDDYISAPKPNGYQSLHTAVVGPEQKTVEVQIRTRDMHDNAELGVAAHWRYKEGAKQDEGADKQLELLRNAIQSENPVQALVAQQNYSDENIYVISPKGKVVQLSAGATPLDFAYHIHTDVGHRCRGAKVDGHMVPLSYTLKSGQQVDIITAKEGTPSRDWLLPRLGYLKTSRAHSKVKQWFKQQYRQENITTGKAALHKEMVQANVQHVDMMQVAKRFKQGDVDDLYAAIGRSEIGVHQAMNIITELTRPQTEEISLPTQTETSKRFKKSENLVIQGVGDLMTYMARCCKPVPGDRVTGFITRGRGVSVHRQKCTNLKRLMKDHPERVVDVNWGGSEDLNYEVDVEIDAMDRSGLLRDVTSVLASENINVLAANTHTNRKTQEVRMRITMEILNSEQLDRALNKLIQLRNVLETRRTK